MKPWWNRRRSSPLYIEYKISVWKARLLAIAVMATLGIMTLGQPGHCLSGLCPYGCPCGPSPNCVCVAAPGETRGQCYWVGR